MNKNELTPTFAVNARLQATSTGTLVPFAKLQFDYADDSTLKRIFDDRVYRYPPTDSLSAMECAAPGGETYARQDTYVHQFAIFSAYARTTNGGVFETKKRTKSQNESPQLNLLQDGRLAGKPFLFHNPSRSNFITNLANEKPSTQAYELNFQPFLSKGDYQGYMDLDVNRVPALTGNRATSGIKSGSYLEVPSGPLQTIADFRRSNALTTSHLPHFVQPVGNSLLHPLMSADKVIESNPGITSTQMIQGPFNVNSTSVQAWKAMLASMNKSEIATLWARTAGLETRLVTGVPITGMSLLNGGANPGSAVGADKIDNLNTNLWNGFRVITDTELENLAVKIVSEIRARGPFLSMSEFVNRQIGSVGPLTIRGALEAAITKSEINEAENAVSPATFLGQVPINPDDFSDLNLYNYKTLEATTGNPAAGAPGWVNQGDLLRILEPSATVRGDTFVIRAYGEAQDANGKITARAFAEAVVQRFPEYVDPANRPSINPYSDPAATVANRTFGRRFNVVSFRWLSDSEV